MGCGSSVQKPAAAEESIKPEPSKAESSKPAEPEKPAVTKQKSAGKMPSADAAKEPETPPALPRQKSSGVGTSPEKPALPKQKSVLEKQKSSGKMASPTSESPRPSAAKDAEKPALPKQASAAKLAKQKSTEAIYGAEPDRPLQMSKQKTGSLQKQKTAGKMPSMKKGMSSYFKRSGTVKLTPAYNQWSACVAAWSAGKFNDLEARGATIEEFFEKEATCDLKASSGHARHSAFKTYAYGEIKDWFDFLASFDLAGIAITGACAPSPTEVWQKWDCPMATCKATGKGAPDTGVCIFTFGEGDTPKITKITCIYSDPTVINSICIPGGAPVPATPTYPSFEPHTDPKARFDECYGAWGAGEFANGDTKQATFDKWLTADVMIEATTSVMPDVFKTYTGHAGFDAFINGVIGETWDFKRMDSSAVAGIKPGCVLQKFAYDVKHKTTGKEASGVEIYWEWAFNKEGKMVYGKAYYANPLVAASIY